MTREIVFDTETTGLDCNTGDRLVEVGCVELINHLPTGVTFQRYINPERDMPEGARAVHGLTEEFLRKHPVFPLVVDEFLEFIGDSPLVIHNAEFDMKFLNWELGLIGRTPIPRARAIDTLTIARKRFPGAPASLKALCQRFEIDNSARTWHGALLDAHLLADVYLELIGGREPGLVLMEGAKGKAVSIAGGGTPRPPRTFAPNAAEEEAHQAFLARLKNPVWLT